MRLCNIFFATIAFFLVQNARAETLETKIGSMVLPEGLVSLEKKEEVDAATGRYSGLFVFTKANDAPRAIFIVSYTVANPDPVPFEPLLAAVKIGNPFDASLTVKDAAKVLVGGVSAGRFEGILPNGLQAISYAVENQGYRTIVLLKGPKKSPYEKLMKEFAASFEKMQWSKALVGAENMVETK